MKEKSATRPGVAGTAAIVIGAILLAIGATGAGAALLVAGIIGLASDGIVLIARFAVKRLKTRP